MGKWIAAAVFLTLWYGLPPVVEKMTEQAVQDVDINHADYR